jgi:hypothetical protein
MGIRAHSCKGNGVSSYYLKGWAFRIQFRDCWLHKDPSSCSLLHVKLRLRQSNTSWRCGVWVQNFSAQFCHSSSARDEGEGTKKFICLQYFVSRIIDECKLTWNALVSFLDTSFQSLIFCSDEMVKRSSYSVKILVLVMWMSSDNVGDVITGTVSLLFLSSVLQRRMLYILFLGILHRFRYVQTLLISLLATSRYASDEDFIQSDWFVFIYSTKTTLV